jgi:thiamine-monophosphate kinase
VPPTAASPILLGIGDDAALLDLPPGEVLVTSVDTLVECVHYPEDTFPEDVGYRALAVAASDLAAMGASPLACTLALTLPAVDELWLQAFSEGLAQACAAFRLPLAGGDTTRGPGTVITLQVFGACPADAALRRDGARPGDQVCISGTLGDAAAGLAILEERWHPAWPAVAGGAGEAGAGTGAAATEAAEATEATEAAEAPLARFLRPTPRLALGERIRGVATAAIDVSDGLLADLGHVAAASGVAIALDSAALPLSPALAAAGEQGRAWALGGGDDYELAFTLPADASIPEGCTRIGEVREGAGLSVDGEPADASGYRHF